MDIAIAQILASKRYSAHVKISVVALLNRHASVTHLTDQLSKSLQHQLLHDELVLEVQRQTFALQQLAPRLDALHRCFIEQVIQNRLASYRKLFMKTVDA